MRRLEGEYAFAIWDAGRGQLVLARGPGSNRPIFYLQLGGDFIFASEMSLLLKWPHASVRANEAHVAHWIVAGPGQDDETFVTGVQTVPPGARVLRDERGVARETWWHPEDAPQRLGQRTSEQVEGLIEVLDRSLADRLHQDEATGAHLSGGLDSGAVTASAARLLGAQGRRLWAFTAVPRHPVALLNHFADEGGHAAAVASMYSNIDHVLVRHGSHSVFAMIDLFSSAQAEPLVNPMNYEWIYEICLQAKRRRLTSLLTGNSGNLTFSYSGERALQSLASRGRLLAMFNLMRQVGRGDARRWIGLVKGIVYPWVPAPARRWVERVRGRSGQPLRSALVRQEFVAAHVANWRSADQTGLRVDSRQWRLLLLRAADHGTWMDPFRRLTGVSMSDPSGDRRVVEYCLSVPPEHFCAGGIARSLARAATAARLPDLVRNERRRGYQAADVAIHFRDELSAAFAEIRSLHKSDLASRVLDLPRVEASLARFQASSPPDNSTISLSVELLRIIALGRFLRRLEDGTLFRATPALDITSL